LTQTINFRHETHFSISTLFRENILWVYRVSTGANPLKNPNSVNQGVMIQFARSTAVPLSPGKFVRKKKYQKVEKKIKDKIKKYILKRN